MQGLPVGQGQLGRLRYQLAELRTKRIGQAHMGDTSLPKKSWWTLLGAVDELIGHHHVPRPYRGL
jgi:hypothetical protein